MRALARTIGTDPMSVKRCADELEGRGLLTSGQLAADRRPRTLTLTTRGTTTVATVNERLMRQEATFDAVLDAGARTTFEALLTRLEHALDIGSDVVASSTQSVERRPTAQRKQTGA